MKLWVCWTVLRVSMFGPGAGSVADAAVAMTLHSPRPAAQRSLAGGRAKRGGADCAWHGRSAPGPNILTRRTSRLGLKWHQPEAKHTDPKNLASRTQVASDSAKYTDSKNLTTRLTQGCSCRRVQRASVVT